LKQRVSFVPQVLDDHRHHPAGLDVIVDDEDPRHSGLIVR
jgi:hypothetical protein